MRNLILFLFLGTLLSCNSEKVQVSITPDLESITPEGYRYTPSTQSFLRGHHWLNNIVTGFIEKNNDLLGNIDFKFKESSHDKSFNVKNIPLNHIVPRLHYKINKEADEFDYFNLMMAEYSRNGISFPYGKDGDNISHFETDLKAESPWILEDNYEFKPNPIFKPLRFSVINNCLAPTLWELSARDKTGEIYHSWFKFPEKDYYDIVAKVNSLPEENIKNALKWKDEKVALKLDRLRKVNNVLGVQNIKVIDEAISYSTQGSRQKLSKGFVVCKEGDKHVKPKSLKDITAKPVKMAKFIPPGLYSMEEKMDFDFNIYENPIEAKVSVVDPLTSYNFDSAPFKRDNLKYIELEIQLPDNTKLIIGNLPLKLLVKQEDFPIHGFGVGILSAGGFAERRRFLLEQGFHPSFVYLVKEENGKLVTLNSHEKGLEQVFIRSFPNAETPHWDITFTSYERITDIVKYRINISPELIDEQIKHTEDYVTPIYFSYRDDNIR